MLFGTLYCPLHFYLLSVVHNDLKSGIAGHSPVGYYLLSLIQSKKIRILYDLLILSVRYQTLKSWKSIIGHLLQRISNSIVKSTLMKRSSSQYAAPSGLMPFSKMSALGPFCYATFVAALRLRNLSPLHLSHGFI